MTAQHYDDNQLKDLGKAAADLSCVSGLPMDEAVTQKLANLQLNEEQVRRVVEHANITAFRNKHASMKAPNRVVEFDDGPADPSVVWSQLRSSAEFSGMPPVDLSASDYASEPSMKIASAPEFHLTSEVDPPVVAAQKLASLYDQLGQAHGILIDDRERASLGMREALDNLGGSVKSAMLQDITPTELRTAWYQHDPQYVEPAVRACGVPADTAKVASLRRINPDSAVVRHYAEFTKHAHLYDNRNQAALEVERRMLEVEEAYGELAKAAGLKGVLQGAKRLYRGTSVGKYLGNPKSGLNKAAKGVALGTGALAAGTAGLGMYGAYKGIQGAGNVISGTGRAIGNIGSGGQQQ